MAQSRFKKRKNESINKYTKKLVSMFVDYEEEERMERLEHRAIGKLKNHRFIELHPKDIERQIEGIKEKFVIHNQLEKADRFDKLVQEFRDRTLKNDYDNINHQILKLLVTLSNNCLKESSFGDETILKNLKRGKGNVQEFIKKPNLRDIIDISDEEESEEEPEDEFEDFDDDIDEDETGLDLDILNQEKERIKSQLKKIKQRGSKKKNMEIEKGGKKGFRESMGTAAYFGGLPFSLRDLEKDKELVERSTEIQIGGKRDLTDFSTSVDMTEEDNKDKSIFLHPNLLSSRLKESIMTLEREKSASNLPAISHWIFSEKTEREVVEALLILLMSGEDSRFFYYDLESARYKTRTPFEFSHLSSLALRNSMERFLRFQTMRREITNFIDGNFNSGLVVLESIIFEIIKEENSFQTALSKINLRLNYQSGKIEVKNHNDSRQLNHTLTLQNLETFLNQFEPTYFTIHKICSRILLIKDEVDHFVKSSINQAEAKLNRNCFFSTFIQNDFLSILEEIDSSFDSNRQIKLVKNIFISLFSNYFQFISNWVKYGELNDPNSEFFIQKLEYLTDEQNKSSLRIKWNEDFKIRKIVIRGNQKVYLWPKLYRALGAAIMLCGKTALLSMYLNLQKKARRDKGEIESDDLCQELIAIVKSKFDVYGDQAVSFGMMEIEDRDFGDMEAQVCSEIENDTKKRSFNNFVKEKRKVKMVEKNRTKTRNREDLFNFVDEGVKVAGSNGLLDSLITDEFELLSSNLFLQSSIFNTGKVVRQENRFFESQIFSNHAMSVDFEQRKKMKKMVMFRQDAKMNKKLKNFLRETFNTDILFGQTFIATLNESLNNLIWKNCDRNNSKLKALLTQKFNIRQLYKNIWNLYFLQKVHYAQISFYELLEDMDINNINSCTEKFKITFKEMLENIQENFSSYFRVIRGNIKELSTSLGEISGYNLQIKYIPPYPMEVVFTKEAMLKYHKVFLFLMYLERAKRIVTSKYYFLKQFKGLQELKINIGGERASLQLVKGLEDPRMRRMFNNLIKKMRIAQQEYIHFLNMYNKFAKMTIIQNSCESFDPMKHLERGISYLRSAHDDFLNKILEALFLTEKGENILETIVNCIESGINFGSLCRRLEEALLINEEFDEDLEDQMITIHAELKENLACYRKSILLILRLLHQYKLRGVNFKLNELLTELNFNYYYIDEGRGEQG